LFELDPGTDLDGFLIKKEPADRQFCVNAGQADRDFTDPKSVETRQMRFNSRQTLENQGVGNSFILPVRLA